MLCVWGKCKQHVVVAIIIACIVFGFFFLIFFVIAQKTHILSLLIHSKRDEKKNLLFVNNGFLACAPASSSLREELEKRGDEFNFSVCIRGTYACKK